MSQHRAAQLMIAPEYDQFCANCVAVAAKVWVQRLTLTNFRNYASLTLETAAGAGGSVW